MNLLLSLLCTFLGLLLAVLLTPTFHVRGRPLHYHTGEPGYCGKTFAGRPAALRWLCRMRRLLGLVAFKNYVTAFLGQFRPSGGLAG